MSSYRKSDNPIEGAALMWLSFASRDEPDDPNFRAVYKGVLRDLHLTHDEVRSYVRTHKQELTEKLREMATDRE